MIKNIEDIKPAPGFVLTAPYCRIHGGSVIIPGSSSSDAWFCEVIAVGPPRLEMGHPEPHRCGPGDVVMLASGGVIRLYVEGDKRTLGIASLDHVVAVVGRTEQIERQAYEPDAIRNRHDRRATEAMSRRA